MTEPPDGTLTILFTDIEGSTSLARALGDRWPAVLADHHRIVGDAIAAYGGWVDRTEGDAFFALFRDAGDAVAAAVEAQRGLRAHAWAEDVGELRIRCGLHTGTVRRADTGFVGLEIHRGARIGAAAHGGQILISEATRAVLPEGAAVEDVGMHRLKDFPDPQRLFCVPVDGRGAAAFPPPRALPVRPTNLPPARPLLGRDADLAAVRDALGSGATRLLTITGRGGTGKTSLAILAAERLLDDLQGGAWLVRLAAVEEDARVLPAIGEALAVRDTPDSDPGRLVAERIGETPMLLVLDNLEHLPRAGEIVCDLLDAAPGLRVLATSQAPLRVSAELVLPLEPLDVAAAVDLFRDRIAMRRPGLELSVPDREVVAAICKRLDCLPLAIELAAGRAGLLAPREMLSRLDRSLELLRGGARDLPDRQRSLRAAIAWTLGLLDPEAVAVFPRLGVFAGPARLEAIEEICDDGETDVLGALEVLVDLSVLRRVEDPEGTSRFALPQALREAALERLAASGEEQRVRHVHASYLAQRLWPQRWWGITAPEGHREVARTWEDTRAAMEWARHADPPLHARLTASVANHLCWRGRLRDAEEHITAALASNPGDQVRAMLIIWRAYTRSLTGQPQDEREPVASGIALLQDPGDLAIAVAMRSFIASQEGRYGDATRDAREAVSLARSAGHPHTVYFALIFLAQALILEGHHDTAGDALDELDALAPRLQPDQALFHHTVRADWAVAGGDWATAVDNFARSAADAASSEAWLQAVWDLYSLGAALAGAGRPQAGLEVLGIAEIAAQETGGGWVEPSDATLAWTQPQHTAARDVLGADAAEAAMAAGRAVPYGDRIARALALAGVEVERRTR